MSANSRENVFVANWAKESGQSIEHTREMLSALQRTVYKDVMIYGESIIPNIVSIYEVISPERQQEDVNDRSKIITIPAHKNLRAKVRNLVKIAFRMSPRSIPTEQEVQDYVESKKFRGDKNRKKRVISRDSRVGIAFVLPDELHTPQEDIDN